MPKYRLLMNLKLVRRRKPLVSEALIPTAKIVRRKYRTGTLLGRYFRHIFDHKNIKKLLAANFTFLAVTASFLPQTPTIQAQELTADPIIETQTTLVTQKSIQYPTQKVSITQGYSFFHPGIDLDGITGDPVRPIKSGTVTLIEFSKFGYGNDIVINHGNGLSSLYAHLSKIEVEEGQDVTMDTEIGKMGATGRTSGDHLHLEIFSRGLPINPVSVLR